MYIFLLLLWIVFNGKFTLEILWIGAVISAGIYFLCWKFFGYSPKREWQLFKKSLCILEYVVFLVWEILKANLTVVGFILSKKETKPVLVTFESKLKTDTANVLLSHSITLTPGTITVELKGKTFVVHCLDESLADGIDDSVFVRILKKFEA